MWQRCIARLSARVRRVQWREILKSGPLILCSTETLERTLERAGTLPSLEVVHQDRKTIPVR